MGLMKPMDRFYLEALGKIRGVLEIFPQRGRKKLGSGRDLQSLSWQE